MPNGCLRFHQVDDQGSQQFRTLSLRRIPAYGPLQIGKPFHIIKLFALHILVWLRVHWEQRVAELRRKELEGGHISRLSHDERRLLQAELDRGSIRVRVEDIAKARRRHVHLGGHRPDAARIFLHRRLYGFNDVFQCGNIHDFTIHSVQSVAYSGGMKMVHLLITRHGDVWRVRILIPGEPRPCWRTYRAEDYPTPETVARRCIKGLSAVREKTKGDGPAEIPDEASKSPFIQHGLPLRVRWECWPYMS